MRKGVLPAVAGVLAVGIVAAKTTFWDKDCTYPDHQAGGAERPADCHVLIVRGASHADVRWALRRAGAWRSERQPDGTYLASFPLRMWPLAHLRAELEARPGIHSARHRWLDGSEQR